MRTRRLIPLALLLVAACALAACATMNKPPTPGRPVVDVRQASALFFGSGTTAPLNLTVDIQNPAKEPIVVRRIRLQPGPGMTQYSMYPTERTLNQTIAPGETKEISLTATAYTQYSRLDPTEPLGMRTILDYDTGGKHHQELYIAINVSP
jgi:hypothetical protein